MSGAILHGRPQGHPEAEPMRLYIDPGSSTAEEIAELLAAISKLSLLMNGHQIVWTTPSSARKLLEDAPGVYWSTKPDDALCDLGDRGGWLLKIHDREYVVCTGEPEALKLRTEAQLDDLAENHDWSEIPTGPPPATKKDEKAKLARLELIRLRSEVPPYVDTLETPPGAL